MARSDRIVVGASVVVKWFVEEENTEKALDILDNYSEGKVDLISAQLMPFEVMNSLRYNPTLGIQDIMRIGESLSKLQIGLFPLVDGLYAQSMRIAIEYGTTVYDASYLSPAISADCLMYTSDAKFAGKVGRNEHLVLL